MIYLFDTNAIADMLSEQPAMIAQVRLHQQSHVLGLCPPIDYEVQRGLLWRTTSRKYQLYREVVRPQFAWIGLTDSDWQQAAHFWADARGRGQQLSDVDLLLAALAHRLNAVIVSNDGDFDVLPVHRENWHSP